MNSKERYLAMLGGRACDFVPRLPILMQYAAHQVGADYGAFTSDFRVLVKANAECAARFGIDQMNTMSDPYRETEGYGAEVLHDAVKGAVCRKPPLSSVETLHELRRPDPETSRRMRDRLDAVDAFANGWGRTHSVMGWVEGPAAEAADLRGVSDFLVDLLEEPDASGRLMDLMVENALRFAEAQVKRGADTIGIGDAVASQVSAEVHGRLIQPREQRLVDGLHHMGVKVRLHICGQIGHLLPGIRLLDVDVLDVDHMVDLTNVRAAVGSRTALCGNLDPVAHVKQGNPADIRRRVREAYRQAGNPFCAGAGCEIPPGTPEENLMALCEPVAFCP